MKKLVPAVLVVAWIASAAILMYLPSPEAQQRHVIPTTADPASPGQGQVWLSTTTANTAKYHDGTTTRSLVDLGLSQTLSSKTLTAPVISTIVNTGTLTLPTSTDTLTARATTDTLTNKTILAPSNTVSGVLDRDVTTADVVNTTVETVVYSFSVPGGTLGTNRALRLTLIGDYLNNSGADSTLTLRATFGGTPIHGATAVVIATSASRRAIRYEAMLSANNATNAQVTTVQYVIGNAGTAGTAPTLTTKAEDSISVNNGLTLDSALAQTLSISFQHSVANANISARALAVQVEVLR